MRARTFLLLPAYLLLFLAVTIGAHAYYAMHYSELKAAGLLLMFSPIAAMAGEMISMRIDKLNKVCR